MAITDPTDIAGLVFWGDAVVITENPTGFAEIMDNQEGTASEDLSQSTVARRPSIVTVFGKKGLKFDKAIPQSLAGGGGGPIITQGTLVMVLKLPVNEALAKMLFFGRNQAGTTIVVVRTQLNTLLVERDDSAGPSVNITPDVDWSFLDDIVLTVTWNTTGPTATIRVNGIQKGTGDPGAIGGTDGISVAVKLGTIEGADINVYGLVTYNSILTGTNLTDIEAFMTSTYLPVNVLTTNAGPDQTVTADESQNAAVVLDGSASFGPLTIIDFEWKEGTTILATGEESIVFVNLSAGVHVITLTVKDTNGDTDTDTVTITVNAFVPAVIRTFKEITSATGSVHAFNDVFPLTPEVVAPSFTKFHNQVRVFKKDVANVVTELFPVGRPSSAGKTDFTINTAGTSITLDVDLISTDTLVIMRETQINRPFVKLTNVGRFRGGDRNVRGDQILFICQELREIRLIADILGSGVGEAFEYSPLPFDKSDWTQKYVGDGSTTIFLYDNIEMLPLEAVRHAPQLNVFLNDVLQTTGFTVSESALSVTFSVAPGTSVVVKLQRSTRIDKRWITFLDASTFSSLQNKWDFLNVKFIVEETPDFPVFLLPNPLSNRIFPRVLNTITYSGPGDRFFFGNLPWFGDGIIFVFKNDLLLIEITDYTVNFIFFFIDLIVPLVASDTLRITTTTPNHAFGALGFSEPGGEKNEPGGTVDEEFIEPDEGNTFATPETYGFGQGIILEAKARCGVRSIKHSVPRGTIPPVFFRNDLKTVLMEFDIIKLTQVVTEAHVVIDSSRLISTVGSPHPNLHIRRIPKETAISLSLCNPPNISWLEKNIITMAAWSGDNTDTDGNGGRSPLDNDAATEVTVAWPGLPSGGIELNNITILGLAPMVEAARLNGEKTLVMVWYYLGAAGVATEVFDRRTEWQLIPFSGKVRLFTTPSP